MGQFSVGPVPMVAAEPNVPLAALYVSCEAAAGSPPTISTSPLAVRVAAWEPRPFSMLPVVVANVPAAGL